MMDLFRIAARVAAVPHTSLNEDWRMLTEEQISEVMELVPEGTEIHGSYANGKATRHSDLDLSLPADIGERGLSDLVMTIHGVMPDLYQGAINIGMPCSRHDDCFMVSHVDEQHLLPPLIEHIKGGVKDPDSLPDDAKEVRRSKKEHFKEYVRGLETDEPLKVDEMTRRALRKFVDGRPFEEVLEEWKPYVGPSEWGEWVRALENGTWDRYREP